MMPKKATPLNATKIERLKSDPAKDIELYDGDGLVLRVRKNGTKEWLFKYKSPISNKRAKMTIGKYPAMSLKDARKEILSLSEQLSDGNDPKIEKQIQQLDQKMASSNTLESVAADWLVVKKTTVSERHAEKTWRRLELHVFPYIGKLPIDKVLAPVAIDALKPLVAKGSLDTAHRIGEILNQIMTYAVNTGITDRNPLAGIRSAFPSPDTTNNPTLKPEELNVLMSKLNYANVKIVTRILIEFQLHTMVRPSEAAGARWDEFDLEANLWTIQSTRMKSNRNHVVPLTDQAISLLQMMQGISYNSDFVFPSDRNRNAHVNNETANKALGRMGLKGRLTAHGMRSIASTALNDARFDSDLIEVCLAHVESNKTKAAYDRAEYVEPRRPLMVWWSNFIEQAATGNMGVASSANVLSFQQANNR